MKKEGKHEENKDYVSMSFGIWSYVKKKYKLNMPF